MNTRPAANVAQNGARPAGDTPPKLRDYMAQQCSFRKWAEVKHGASTWEFKKLRDQLRGILVKVLGDCLVHPWSEGKSTTPKPCGYCMN